MGMSGGGGGSFNSEINVTPMVDIMLVLLIIFMVVTPFLQQGVTVAIPRETTSPDVDPAIIKETSVVISIPEDGQYYLGKEQISKNDIGTEVKRRMEKKTLEEQIVYIKSGVGVSYGDVVAVIDEIRRKGEVQQIGLVADKKKGGAAVPKPATPTQ
ncbi:MAG TPA: biopolymer transporter ExbD [Pyrinomonadaceae bacterium]|jgi:biopolymer transport protein ExbD/biopolymer transport protein TolR